MKHVTAWIGAFLISGALLEAQDFDLLVRGGSLLDGSGSPPYSADIGIREGRIAQMGDLARASAKRVIEAHGLYVAPGFIDLHSHADWGFSDPELGRAINNLTQGITTVVVGQDGRHAWPLGSDLRRQAEQWRRLGVGNNVVPLIGQGSARWEVLGPLAQAATPEQAQAVAEKVREYLEQGAWGLSTGLSYFPGRFSTTEEVIVATRPLAEIDGFYISHLRNQGEGLAEAIQETIRIGRETGVRVVATHLKSSGRKNWGGSRTAVALMRKAREEGIDIYGDLYPYETSSDGINVSLVQWSWIFTPEEMSSWLGPGKVSLQKRIDWLYRMDPTAGRFFERDFLLQQPPEVVLNFLRPEWLLPRKLFRQRLREALQDETRRIPLLEAIRRRLEGPGGPEIFRVERHADPDLVGLNLAEIARRWGVTPQEAAARLTLEEAVINQYHMAEEDIVTFIQQPFIAGCTDGWIPEFGVDVTHPRSYGAFVRRIRRYVYELGVIDLPFAVHTATALPASIIGLPERGSLRPGYWADIIIFDPTRLRDLASYQQPHRYSQGVQWVLVNGEVALEKGVPTGVKAGKVLLKTELHPPASSRR